MLELPIFSRSINIDVEYARIAGYCSVMDTPELIIDTSAAGIATFDDELGRPAGGAAPGHDTG
jgi:hypothetical protein